jgi:hypothetical protein
VLNVGQSAPKVFSLSEERLCEHVGGGDTSSGVDSPSETLGEHQSKGSQGSMGSRHEELRRPAASPFQVGGCHPQQVLTSPGPGGFQGSGQVALDVACSKNGGSGHTDSP